MSIQNGQPLVATTRRLTSDTSAFGNCPDCSIEAPSSFAAPRIRGHCAMTLDVFKTPPKFQRLAPPLGPSRLGDWYPGKHIAMDVGLGVLDEALQK